MKTTTLDELIVRTRYTHGQKMDAMKLVAELAHCVIKGYGPMEKPVDDCYRQAEITRAYCVATFNAYAESVYSDERIAI